MHLRLVDKGRAEGNSQFAVAVEVGPADRRGVPAAVETFVGEDPFDRRIRWCAADGRARVEHVGDPDHVHIAHPTGSALDASGDRGPKMLHASETHHIRFDRGLANQAEGGEAGRDVVDDELMLGTDLRGGHHLGGELGVGRLVAAGSRRAGEGDGGDLSTVEGDEAFG